MVELDKSRLSKAILEDMEDFAKTGEDAIYWLANGKQTSIDKIITRIQSANIETVATSGLKTVDDWSKANRNFVVRTSVAPVSNDEKYSSFSIIENENSYGKLRYPLTASFASKTLPFSTKTFQNYSQLINKIKSAYKIKIIEKNDNESLFSYKKKGKFTGFIKNIGLGVLNLCRKVFRKDKYRSQPLFKGKIKINSSLSLGSGKRYKFSEQEKFTRVIFALTSTTIDDFAKKDKINLDSKVKAFANLYANVLISRAINYGDERSNKMVETSLTLQMSNTLAGLNIDAKTLNQASKLGLDAALYTINKLGLSIDNVMESMKASGYKYTTTPQTIEEAIAPKFSYINSAEMASKAIELLGLSAESKNDKKVDKVDDALNNPKPKDVIYIAPKVDDALNNPKPGDVIYLGQVDKASKLNGVKNSTIYLTRKSAEKYVDRVVTSRLKRNIENTVKKLDSYQGTEKTALKARRNYNFLEHMYTFYDRSKDLDANQLQEKVESELNKQNIGDNIYAHSYAKSIIDLRRDVVDGVFQGNDKIEKPEGKDTATLINEYTEKTYGSRLATYMNAVIKDCLKTVFKEIDDKTFEQKDLTK